MTDNEVVEPAPGPPPLELERLRTTVRGKLFKRDREVLQVGRYLVTGKLGSGGMGFVYAGRDPELDRPVALKLLHDTGDHEQQRARLLREARAIAKVGHPNVATIYEAGIHNGDVFIAMELVEGRTLRAWLAEKPRSWREVVDVFQQAGRGLWAAHQAGLVHRDFKPDNVLVGDGDETPRVRVVDFGLARQTESSSTDVQADSDSEARHTPTSDRITRTGAIVGTPAYMAPEHRLGNADERSDQYSYCVALHEALFGVHPLLSSRRSAPLTDRTTIPTWLKRIVERGMSTRPEKRFRDLGQLLDAISTGIGRRARALTWVLGAGVIVAALGFAGFKPSDDGPECAPAQQQLAGVWNDEIRDDLALDEPGRGFFDRWVGWWSEANDELCALPQEEVAAERRACLDTRLAQLRTLTGLMQQRDTTLPTETVSALDPITDCVSEEVARSALHLPIEPAQLEKAMRIRLQRLEARRLRHSGASEESNAILARLEAEAIAAQMPALVAEIEYERAQVLAEVGDKKLAEELYERAASTARVAHHPRIEAQSWSSLIQVSGYGLARLDDALRWSERAKAVIASLGMDPSLEANRLQATAMAHLSAGNTTEAVDHLARALEIRETQIGYDRYNIARLLATYSGALRRAGDSDAAIATARRANEIFIETGRERHVDRYLALMNLASALLARNKREALEVYAEAYELGEAKLEAGHIGLAKLDNNMGSTLVDLGDVDQALPRLQRALKGFEAKLGPDHPEVASALTNLGRAQNKLGRYDLAVRHLRRALEIRKTKLEPGDPRTSNTHTELGDALRKAGRCDEAVVEYRAALAIEDKQALRDAIDQCPA